MAGGHGVAFALAALWALLLLLPCVVVWMVDGHAIRDRIAGRWRQARQGRREQRTVAQLDRTLGTVSAEDARLLHQLSAEAHQPPIERIAADLRRLNQLRVGVAIRSPVWHTAVTEAYDGRLRLACRRLGVAEHLGELGGSDLDIERVRVEGELEATGLALRPVAPERRQDHC